MQTEIIVRTGRRDFLATIAGKRDATGAIVTRNGARWKV